jgi:GT2 family glycosyltransferase
MSELGRSRQERNSRRRPAPEPFPRPRADGKFLFVGNQKLWVRGATYGAFRPDPRGEEYHDLARIDLDFAQMAASGFNAVRIPHTVPPRSLLDTAQRHGLRVMVGLSAEQQVGFLIDRRSTREIEKRVREAMAPCLGHPALLCYAIGNEIPAPIARWIGRRGVERYIERLYRVIKQEDPDALVSYVNYPTTEYLELPFLDLLSFNVYLEDPDRFAAYLGRLQSLAGDRPLLMSELGLDSLRNGEQAQAKAIAWQIRSTFAAGCAGAFVFSWTDEWHRSGADVSDWRFGLTDAERKPKPALAAACEAFRDPQFSIRSPRPKISVVICSYNGARTIRRALESVRKLDYPDYEVIVVDDGSTDATAEIVAEYGVRQIQLGRNRGLANARNVGMEAADGEIVAYLDDDAYPDTQWLSFLADGFAAAPHAAMGGPNVPPRDAGFVADCISSAPGGPAHVLLSDDRAEHLPGCNLAIRKDALQAIGGFDPRFRAAGDDVDVCWRLQEAGWTLGFRPAAMVWHERRGSIAAYWRQQCGYGQAEALLERKWPEKYNRLGYHSWRGRIYASGMTLPIWRRERVYQGVFGSSPFQSLHQSPPGMLASLPLMPDWFAVIALLSLSSALGVLWSPMLLALPLLAGSVGVVLAQAGLSAARARRHDAAASRWAWWKGWAFTTFLHLLHPIARLRGRLRHGLNPWRRRLRRRLALPWRRKFAIWREQWAETRTLPALLSDALRAEGVPLAHGGEYDDWDLEVPAGLFGRARAVTAIEDHGGGARHLRIRAWPEGSLEAKLASAFLGLLAGAALLDGALLAGIILVVLTSLIVARVAYECSLAMAAIVRGVRQVAPETSPSGDSSGNAPA